MPPTPPNSSPNFLDSEKNNQIRLKHLLRVSNFFLLKTRSFTTPKEVLEE
jgi:hypothetical protein